MAKSILVLLNDKKCLNAMSRLSTLLPLDTRISIALTVGNWIVDSRTSISNVEHIPFLLSQLMEPIMKGAVDVSAGVGMSGFSLQLDEQGVGGSGEELSVNLVAKVIQQFFNSDTDLHFMLLSEARRHFNDANNVDFTLTFTFIICLLKLADRYALEAPKSILSPTATAHPSSFSSGNADFSLVVGASIDSTSVEEQTHEDAWHKKMNALFKLIQMAIHQLLKAEHYEPCVHLCLLVVQSGALRGFEMTTYDFLVQVLTIYEGLDSFSVFFHSLSILSIVSCLSDLIDFFNGYSHSRFHQRIQIANFHPPTVDCHLVQSIESKNAFQRQLRRLNHQNHTPRQPSFEKTRSMSPRVPLQSSFLGPGEPAGRC